MNPIRVLFFDLDETLYPKSNGVWSAISDRIHAYIIDRLDLTHEEADTIRSQFLEQYGTTLEGLRIRFGIDPLDYLEFVHDIPIEEMIDPDPELETMLRQLYPRRLIFTNASINHANRVLQVLGVQGLFDQIIDILALNLRNKPKPAAYQRALALAGNPAPEECLIIDDRIPNLVPAKTLGMKTVLVGNGNPGSEVDYCIPRITDLLKTLPELGR
jgi:putative hydrolase of the HAD superfamily